MTKVHPAVEDAYKKGFRDGVEETLFRLADAKEFCELLKPGHQDHLSALNWLRKVVGLKESTTHDATT